MSRPSCFSAYFRSTARSASLFSHLSFTTQTYSADARALKFTAFAGVESLKITHGRSAPRTGNPEKTSTIESRVVHVGKIQAHHCARRPIVISQIGAS